ncbi:hypothetical protein OU800_21225 [Pseudomonas sp. GOM7]|uniref:hypothetical protein n=1 Tax=Pseudomonas sp. GOM7 TaxID=2998079 RepID=UPI00227B760F|nr:hypothetical protein [Pseudomonas sp. GOM7]WAJ37099.1 hypothetical protein OU800_21225 [Pseudomonas sp. GOM7]
MQSTDTANSTRVDNTLKLPARCEEQASHSEEENLQEQPRQPCTTQYDSIIYATGERAFWLLPQTAVDAMQESSHQLTQALSPDLDADARKLALDDYALLEYFLEPKLSNFLEGEQRARMQYFESEYPSIADPALELHQRDLREDTVPDYRTTTDRDEAMAQHEDMLRRMEELRQLQILHREWLELRKVAHEKAKILGYVVENEQIFMPEAIAARDAVQAYLQARDALLEDGPLPKVLTSDLDKAIKESQVELDEVLAQCSVDCRPQLMSYKRRKAERLETVQKHKAYVEAMLKAAQYGLALPEFALAGSEAQLAEGVSAYQRYLDLLQEQKAINQRIADRYEQWLNATGKNLAAPAGLFDAERAKWDELQQALDELRQLAQSNVVNSEPRRTLLWEPESFAPVPVERLVKTNFPLREFSAPKGERILEQFSLQKMLTHLGKDIDKLNTEGLQYGDAVSGAGSVASQTSTALEAWLKEQGGLRLEDQEGGWFDKEGLFDIDRFHGELQKRGYQVTTLEDEASRKSWGDTLRQVLFQDKAGLGLNLFNASPQSQLIRCLTPPVSNVHKVVTTTAPSFSMAEGFTASAGLTLDWSPARGEVQLCDVELPSMETAKSLSAHYYNYRNEKVFIELGRFALYFNLVAWGFAGASLMLNGSLRLGPSKNSQAPSIDTQQEAERGVLNRTYSSGPMSESHPPVDGGLTGKFDVFAGIQAGIKLVGALNWAPPQDVAARFQAPLKSGAALAEQAKKQWMPLAQLDGSISAALGIGAKGDFSLSLVNRCLVLKMRAALIVGPGVEGEFTFAVGYQAIAGLLDIYRRELYRNQGYPLDWVDQETREFLDKLNLLSLVGLDTAMIFLKGYDLVMSLYEALTRGGKGGPIAHSLMTYSNPEELRRWIVEATPAALGPILWTLSSPAEAFTAVDYVYNEETQSYRELKKPYTHSGCWLVQQRAIERVLGWVVQHAQSTNSLADARIQFYQACIRMNAFGEPEPKAGQAYCSNRLAIDEFMREGVERVGREGSDNDLMRARYKKHMNILDQNFEKICRVTSWYSPAQSWRQPIAHYIGSEE